MIGNSSYIFLFHQDKQVFLETPEDSWEVGEVFNFPATKINITRQNKGVNIF